MDIKLNNTTVGTVLDFVRSYEAQKVNVVSLEGVPYTQTPGKPIHRRTTHVFCDTYEKRDTLDGACNNGSKLTVECDGQTFVGYIEEKAIKWKLWRDGHGVGKFTFLVKEVVDE